MPDAVRGLPRSKVTVAELTNLVGTPRVAGTRTGDYTRQASKRDLEVLNVKDFGALYPVWGVELSKGALAPDVELAVRAEGGRERSSSDFDHPAEGELLKEGGESATLGGLPGAELPCPIRAEGEDLALVGQDDGVLLATGYLRHLVRHPLHVVRRLLICSRPKAELALAATATHEEAADLVDEGRVVTARVDLPHIGLIVLVEVHTVRCPCDLLRALGATLAKVVVTPRKGFTRASQHQSVRLPACDSLQFKIEERVDENRGVLSLDVGLIDAKLATAIVTHRITQARCRDEGGMLLTTGNLVDRNVVRAEAGEVV